MYNIAITNEKETAFFSNVDGKPKKYPTLADALASAQYLGLARQDADLHFVREGTPIDAFSGTAKPKPEQKAGGSKGKDGSQ